jgi:cysteine-rich repeat protein
VQKFNQWGNQCNWYYSFSENLNAFQTYNFYVQYSEYTGNAAIILSWSTPSSALTTIPSTGYSVAADIDSSPYQITIVCPFGYEQVGTTHACRPICGDGYIFGDEVCDDANTKDLDGCSSTWMAVEQSYIWIKEEEHIRKVWKEWSAGYHPNSAQDNWLVKPNTAYLNALIWVYTGWTVFITIMSLLYAFLNASKPGSMFNFVNVVQLQLLLPIIGAYLPYEVIKFLVGLKYFMFSFSFFSVKAVEDQINWLDYQQFDPYLSLLDLESSSAMINLISICKVVAVTAAIHLICAVLKCLTSRSCKNKFWGKLSSKIFKWLTFDWYIQFWMEIYLIIWIAVFSELYYLKKGFAEKDLSIPFLLLLLVFILLTVLISFYWWVKRSVDENFESNIIKTCFDGVKGNLISYSYFLQFFLRRLLLSGFILMFADLELLSKTWVFASIQGAYSLLNILIRPQKDKKDQLQEILNELCFTVLIVLLFFWKTKEDWSKLRANIYLWIMIASNIITLLLITSNHSY